MVENERELEQDARRTELCRGDIDTIIADLYRRGYSLEEIQWLVLDALKHYYR